MKKVLLYNPPGGLWLRGEARCEQDIDHATAFTVIAPTSLCYLGAIFRGEGIEPNIADCPVEGISDTRFFGLLRDFSPDMAILNASVLNLDEDLETLDEIRRVAPDVVNVVILPYLNSIPVEQIEYGTFEQVDIIIVGEAEAVAYDLAAYLAGRIGIGDLRGVILNDRERGVLRKGPPIPVIEDLDRLPFPARDLISSELYVRPDVGRPMAAIVDGRGCPSGCIYCLAPITTGTRVRKRSPDSVVAEIAECVERHGVRDFLFRSDTFTIRKEWVLEFCDKVRRRGLDISWAANSRTNTFDRERAAAMKGAGCFLVEFGVESGSDRSLALQKKGTTTAQALQAVAVAREAGLLTYATVLIGLPWEGPDDIRETEAFIRRLNPDFIEVQVAIPYRGTEFYEMMLADGMIDTEADWRDMIRNRAVRGTRQLSRGELLEWRRWFLRRFYLRPAYIARTVSRLSSREQFIQYARHGLRLARNLIRGR